MKKQNTFKFNGFEQSNTTPVPDVLFDELLAELNGSEIKVLLYIIRRTRGFKKDTDAISLSQFQKGITTQEGKVLDRGCGIGDRATIVKALESLEEKCCIETIKGKTKTGDNAITLYRVCFKAPSEVVGKTNQGGRENQLPLVGKTNWGSMENPTGVVGKTNPQETVLQQTDKQEGNTPDLSQLSLEELQAEIAKRQKPQEQPALPSNVIEMPPATPAKTNTKSLLTNKGQHIKALWKEKTGRNLSETPANVKALNGLGDVVECDEDFNDVYTMMKTDPFYVKNDIRVDVDLMYRKFDGFIGKVDDFRRAAARKKQEEERKEQEKLASGQTHGARQDDSYLQRVYRPQKKTEKRFSIGGKR